MNREFEKQWDDFSGRYGTRPCPFCKEQALDFANARRGNVVRTDVVAGTCGKCGHIELFDVSEVVRVADEIDKEYHDKGWR